MFRYRLKQFLWATTSLFKPIDKKILQKYLNKKELSIFKQMKISEQQHCIRVCKQSLVESDKWNDIDKVKLAKIALLHDVGKIEGNLTVIDKSIIVILDKITKGRLQNYTFIKKVDVYYNHGEKSLQLLKKVSCYDKEFLEAVEKHHYKESCNNNYLKIIKICDNNN